MSDDSAASPAAVLRAIVASAVDGGLGDGETRIVGRDDGGRSEESDGLDSGPVDLLAEIVGAADSVVAVVPRLDAALARRLNDALEGADGDGLAALLTSDASSVREWAAATCRRHLAAAEPVE